MAVTRPAIRARMGSTTYYETTLTARDLASTVRPPKETEAWATASIEERMQRELNLKRVKAQIAPYLAQHPDRFFGSFIVLVRKGSLVFESLESVAKELPLAYRGAAPDLGFITIDKGELIALDGQHRLVAFREVINGNQDGPFAGKVGEDEVCVLFLEEESNQKTRRIFNKVNRHAKPTGRSDNIITSEDDGHAIVTRRLLDRDAKAPLAARPQDGGGPPREIVNWQSTTLSARSEKLTTISAVYETVKDILSASGGFDGFREQESAIAPREEKLDEAYDLVARWYEAILTMDAFKNALAIPEEIPNVRESSEHQHALLLRPVGQIALVKGLARAIERSKGKLSLAEAVRRANRVDWSATPASIWRDTIVTADGRMVARGEAYDLAAELLAWMIGSEFTTEETERALWRKWNMRRGKDPDGAPDEIEEEAIPQDLPEPIR